MMGSSFAMLWLYTHGTLSWPPLSRELSRSGIYTTTWDSGSKALNAKNRLVDLARNQVPISGTQIRENPFKFREFMHPVVYRDLIINVAFLGAPSTGKTTIAKTMAAEFNTMWMPEYGREYWEKHQVNRRLSSAQLAELAEEHLKREDELLLQSNRYLFTDTNAITTYTFCRYYHGAVPPRLAELARQAAFRYDLCFVCDTDIPYEDTWDRSGEVNRAVFQKQVIGDLADLHIPYFVLRGTLSERVAYVKHILASFRKYMNVLDIPARSAYR